MDFVKSLTPAALNVNAFLPFSLSLLVTKEFRAASHPPKECPINVSSCPLSSFTNCFALAIASVFSVMSVIFIFIIKITICDLKRVVTYYCMQR